MAADGVAPDDPFTCWAPDAMEMYDELRRRRQEGMYMRLSAMVALSARPLPPIAFVTVPPADD